MAAKKNEREVKRLTLSAEDSAKYRKAFFIEQHAARNIAKVVQSMLEELSESEENTWESLRAKMGDVEKGSRLEFNPGTGEVIQYEQIAPE